MNEFEIKIVKYFNGMGGKKTDDFLGFVNSIRFLVAFWFLIVAAAVVKHPEIRVEFVVSVFVVAVLHFLITEGVLKHLLTHFWGFRKRPYVEFPGLIRPIGKKFSDSSFPSSHMATTASMLVVIAAFYPSLTIFAFALGLVMAFSRLHNGMHYPSDIIFGTVLGFLYGYIALLSLQWI